MNEKEEQIPISFFEDIENLQEVLDKNPEKAIELAKSLSGKRVKIQDFASMLSSQKD